LLWAGKIAGGTHLEWSRARQFSTGNLLITPGASLLMQAAQNGGPGGFAGPGAGAPGKYSPQGGGNEP